MILRFARFCYARARPHRPSPDSTLLAQDRRKAPPQLRPCPAARRRPRRGGARRRAGRRRAWGLARGRTPPRAPRDQERRRRARRVARLHVALRADARALRRAHHPGMRRREHHRGDQRAHRGRGSGLGASAARPRRPRDRAAGSAAGGAPLPALHRVGPGRHGRGRCVEGAAPVSGRRAEWGRESFRGAIGWWWSNREAGNGKRGLARVSRFPFPVSRFPLFQLISSHASVACFLHRSQVRSLTSVPNPWRWRQAGHTAYVSGNSRPTRWISRASHRTTLQRSGG